MRSSPSLLALALMLPNVAAAHHLHEPVPFERVLEAADKDYVRRRYERALDGFHTALGLATRADNQIYAKFQIAQTLRKMGRLGRARGALRRIVREHPRHPKAARSLWVAARMRELDLKDPKGAEREYLALIRRYPRSHPAARALNRLSRLRAKQRLGEAVALLKRVYRRYRPTRLGPRAVYLGAKLYETKAGNPEQALWLYEMLLRRFPKSALRDDSLWHAARLCRKLKFPRRALRHLRRIVATREESWALGSYNSTHLDRAAFTIGLVYMEDLGDPGRGAEMIRSFLDEYPHSFRRIEAKRRYLEALLKLGRRDAARKMLDEMIKMHPDSRHTRLARALFAKEKG